MRAMLDSTKFCWSKKTSVLKQHFIDFMAQLGITDEDKLIQLENHFLN